MGIERLGEAGGGGDEGWQQWEGEPGSGRKGRSLLGGQWVRGK